MKNIDGAACIKLYHKLSESEESIKLLCQLHMFNPLHRSTNQELFKKHFCNQSSHYENNRQVPLRKESHHELCTTKSTLFAVNKDEWDTSQKAPRRRIVKPVALAVIKLR